MRKLSKRLVFTEEDEEEFQKQMKNSGDTSEQKNVEYVTPTFSLHTFIEDITERKIVFQAIKMLDSVFIYINDKDRMCLNDLSVALQNRYDNSPMGTRLMGNFVEEASKSIACRLSKKINKAVFLSCNLEPDRLLIPLVEKRLNQEIKNCPDKF